MPDLPNVQNSSIGAFLHYNHGDYPFPYSYMVLVAHLMTADTLGADDYLRAIRLRLCPPTNQIDLSNSEAILVREVRDRYQLSR